MKNFAACLIFATVQAVPMDRDFQLNSISNLLFSDKIQNSVDSGAITMIDSDTVIDTEASEKIPTTVTNELDAVKSVFWQIEAGFDAIADINTEVEAAQLYQYSDDQAKEIEEIFEEANDGAADIISEESDVSDAQDDIADLMEDAAKAISEINVEHDANIAEAAKTALVAGISNDSVKETLLSEVMGLVGIGSNVGDWVEHQGLPFSVQAPPVVLAGEPSEDKLDRIVARSGDGDIVATIKKDPEFNSFLDGVLKRRQALENERYAAY